MRTQRLPSDVTFPTMTALFVALSLARTIWHDDPFHVPRLNPITASSGSRVVNLAVTWPPVCTPKAWVIAPLRAMLPEKVSVTVVGVVGWIGVVALLSLHAAAMTGTRMNHRGLQRIDRRMNAPSTTPDVGRVDLTCVL